MEEIARIALPPETSSQARARRLVAGCTAGLVEAGALDGRGLSDLLLMTSELVANAVVHGHPSAPIDVAVEADAGRLRVSVHDRGEGFDPEAVDPSMPPPVQVGGRGLALVHALSSDWGAARTGSMLVWCEIPLGRRPR
jgi:anti-sigma regulatory factor (Ser/Thr protein kinase)